MLYEAWAKSPLPKGHIPFFPFNFYLICWMEMGEVHSRNTFPDQGPAPGAAGGGKKTGDKETGMIDT